MADEENESKSSNEKPEVKEDDSPSEEKLNKAEDEKATESASASEEEEKPEIGSKKIGKSLKTVEKSPKKKNSPKEEEKDEEDDEEEDDEDEELPPGLLERPLEVEGKREKKKVERLSASMMRSPQDKKKVEIEEGSGTKLGDIPYIEHQLNVTKAGDLKTLHRVLFFRAGANNEVKKNIRQFSGFTHSKDSKDHERRMASLNKMVLAELKAICVVLGLERSGTKPNLVDRVIDFLMKPEDKGLKVKAKKRSRSSGAKTKGTKKKTSKDSKKKGKVKKDDDSLNDNSDEDEEKEDEDDEEKEKEEEIEEDEGEEEEDEDDSDYGAPKKKKAKKETKKKTPKKSVKENGKKEKTAPKKETKKVPVKKPPVVEDDSLSEDSEDEPIASIKKSPPTNEEIKDLVKKILDGADLETVTMKTVVKQVYSKYPSFDLSDRKDFIKDTVRKVIS